MIHRVGRVRTPASRLDVAVALAAMLLSVVAGALIVANPMLAFAPIALLGGALHLTDGPARTLFVVFGGMLLLQRPGGLDAWKLAFLAACAVAFAGALANVRNLRHTPAYEAARPLLAGSVAVLALLLSTGTRSTLALLLIPLAITLIARRERVIRTMRLLALGPLAAVLTLAAAMAVISMIGANTEHLNERLALVTVTANSEEISATSIGSSKAGSRSTRSRRMRCSESAPARVSTG